MLWTIELGFFWEAMHGIYGILRHDRILYENSRGNSRVLLLCTGVHHMLWNDSCGRSERGSEDSDDLVINIMTRCSSSASVAYACWVQHRSSFTGMNLIFTCATAAGALVARAFR